MEALTCGQKGVLNKKLVVDFLLPLETMQYYILNSEISPQLTSERINNVWVILECYFENEKLNSDLTWEE